MGTLVIQRMGHWFPPHVVENSFFGELDIGSDATWIEERVGIKERRSVLTKSQIKGLRLGTLDQQALRASQVIPTIADLTREAGKNMSDRFGPNPSADVFICGTSVPDWDIPANAASGAHALGLSCPVFDVNSACSSFVVNLHVLRGLFKSGFHKTGYIVNPERYTLRLNFADRSHAILFGDGCALTYAESRSGSTGDSTSEGLEVLDTVVYSDPENFKHVQIPDGGHFWQNGSAVQKFAVTKTVSTAKELLRKHGLGIENLSYFIGHQANLRMLQSVSEKLGLNPSQHLWNVDYFGNQGGSGAPNVLSLNWNKFKKGDLILLVVVGSGLTWGGALLKKV